LVRHALHQHELTQDGVRTEQPAYGCAAPCRRACQLDQPTPHEQERVRILSDAPQRRAADVALRSGRFDEALYQRALHPRKKQIVFQVCVDAHGRYQRHKAACELTP
jgi:hypothetical protein